MATRMDAPLRLAVSRRDFLGGAAGLSFAFAIAGADPLGLVRSAAAGEAGFAPNLWLTIATDGTITIISPAAELGQGTYTTLPIIIAEELDADWAKVRLVRPPFAVKTIYGNPAYGGSFQTSASMSVRAYYKPLRLAGAQARRVLIEAVASAWGVPAAELATEPSVVLHRVSGRRVSYGEIASFAKPPAELPKLEERDLKLASAFRLIGKDLPRAELPLKVRGAAQYAIDVRLPGMIYGAVLSCPYEGGAPDTVDDAKARQVPGVLDVVKLPAGVGVLAANVPAAHAGTRALGVTWTPALGAHFDSEKALDAFAAVARDKTQRGVDFANVGDVEAALPKAQRVMRAEYRTRHLYHAQMEPLSAVARVAPDGKSAEIWAGAQAPTELLHMAARLLETEPDRITFHQQWVGGAYGRRSVPDTEMDALRLAKYAGRPVKVIPTREEDVRAGKFRPMTAHHLEAGLDDQGRIVAWHHRVVAESVIAYMSPARYEALKGKDHILMKGTPLLPYDIPNKRAEFVRQIAGVRLSPWRGVGVGHNLLAIEGFMDEIAHAQGRDPLEFRLAHTGASPRSAHLLRTVAEMAEWGRKRQGTALGIAMEEKDETLVAGVAEISLDRKSGKIKVHNVWAAIDCGVAVQPRNIAAQIEGGIIYGLGHVLREQIDIKDGRVQQSNFTDYEVMRMEDTPNIAVKVVSTDNPPTGAGEDGVPLTAATVGNAFFALTGVRLREVPMSPARVRAALESGKA